MHTNTVRPSVNVFCEYILTHISIYIHVCIWVVSILLQTEIVITENKNANMKWLAARNKSVYIHL